MGGIDMNGWMQKVLVALVSAACLAGAGAIITNAQQQTQVDDLKRSQEKLEEETGEAREKIARIEVQVEQNGEEIEEANSKLDKILDRLPPR